FQHGGRWTRVAFRTHEAGDLLTPFLVGNADNRDFKNVLMLEHRVLDLGREEILAAADDHLFHAPGDLKITARIHATEVAGVEPAFGVYGVRGGFGVVVVAAHHIVAADADLALLVERADRIVSRVSNGNIHMRKRLSNRSAQI